MLRFRHLALIFLFLSPAMAFSAMPMRMEPASANSAIPSRKMPSPSAPGIVDECPAGRHSARMSLARRLAFALLGITLGSSAGGAIGLLGGLAYTEIAGTSGFEGYAGFVVAFWILGGVALGMIIGLVVAYRWARPQSH